MPPFEAILTSIIVIIAIILVFRSIRIVPQGYTLVVERLGKYNRTLGAGLNLLIPVIEKVNSRVDMRERVHTFPPQQVITEDNLMVDVDTVVYFQVTEPKSAIYEIQNFIIAIEQLTITSLRNIVGGMDLEKALTSRDSINGALRGTLDEATGKWGVRINRVELKAIVPPENVVNAMEIQMKADREKRAAILTAEGEKQKQILTAEGARQSAILNAEGSAKAVILEAEAAAAATVLKAEGEAKAIKTVFDAVNSSNATDAVLAYKYLEKIPEIANGQASKIWVLPAELTATVTKITQAFQGK
jgi:regulator of protease activity HflC (stomatin/prohibitin superfamily)